MKLFVFNGARTLLNLDLSINRLLAIEYARQAARDHMKEYDLRKDKGPWGLESLAEFFKGVSKKRIGK